MDRSVRIKIDDVMRAAAKYYGISKAQLLDRSRARQTVRRRMVTMYVAHSLSGKSFVLIGQHFERDHTTVLHAVNKVRLLMTQDRFVRDEVSFISGMLLSSKQNEGSKAA